MTTGAPGTQHGGRGARRRAVEYCPLCLAGCEAGRAIVAHLRAHARRGELEEVERSGDGIVFALPAGQDHADATGEHRTFIGGIWDWAPASDARGNPRKTGAGEALDKRGRTLKEAQAAWYGKRRGWTREDSQP